LWTACLFGGSALGPIVSGVMLEYFWWGSVFLLGVPVMVLLLVTGPCWPGWCALRSPCSC